MKKTNENHVTLNIDLREHQRKDIPELMDYLSARINCNIHYVTENKMKNNSPHIHGVLQTSMSKQTVQRHVNDVFNGSSYKVDYPFDVAGWVGYMTKETKSVLTAKPTNFYNR